MKVIVQKMVVLFLIVIVVFNFAGCDTEMANDFSEKNETITTNNEGIVTNVYSEAEREIKKFFEYYDIESDCFENRGIISISDREFLFLEDLTEEKYSYYVDVKNNKIYGGYPNAGMDCLWSDGVPVESDDWGEYEETPEEYISSYIPLHLGLLDRSYESLKNQMGHRLVEHTNNPSAFEVFYVENGKNMRYFLGENDIFYGIDNGGVSTVSYHYSTNLIRKIINDLELYELFDVEPIVCRISNYRETRAFCYWKVDNGYIGFVILGGVNAPSIYDCGTTNLIIVEDLSAINIF
ncbi:MAG: hypothetical protein IKB12_00410 [Clostridia bacterium]|nr:hypothetical protein [Clostridia bacterium]